MDQRVAMQLGQMMLQILALQDQIEKLTAELAARPAMPPAAEKTPANGAVHGQTQ